jgi:hypothetical protein
MKLKKLFWVYYDYNANKKLYHLIFKSINFKRRMYTKWDFTEISQNYFTHDMKQITKGTPSRTHAHTHKIRKIHVTSSIEGKSTLQRIVLKSTAKIKTNKLHLQHNPEGANR